MANYVRPTTNKGLRSFLGTLSFYRKFLKDLASHTDVLTHATSKAAPPKVIWTEGMVAAFNNIREFMCHLCSLTIPLPSDRFSIITDASGLGIGGMLQILREAEWKTAAYYSRQTKGAETRYSATELEALVVVETVQHFAYYLYGKSFTVFTDHRALCSLTTSIRLNDRLKRLSLKLQPWLVTMEYLPGNDNSLADMLSRQEWREQMVSTGTGGPQPQRSEAKEGVLFLGAGGCEGPPLIDVGIASYSAVFL